MMGDYKRFHTLLQMIRLLSRPGGYSVKRLAHRFDVATRSIYRYFELFRECGFQLEKDRGRYRFQNGGEAESLLPLLSREEASMLRQAVLALHPNQPGKAELIAKLDILGDPGQIAELIVNASAAGAIRKLLEAITEKRQVILRQYQSPNSDTIRDRRVEPVGFSVNMRYLYAYDPDYETVRQFKPERIGSVKITDTHFKPEDHHIIRKPDLFGMNGTPRSKVTLQLNQRATHLLLEEYPESHLLNIDVPSENRFTDVSVDVNGFDGVGRFVLSLPGEAKPEGPPEFIDYLKERMRRGKLG